MQPRISAIYFVHLAPWGTIKVLRFLLCLSLISLESPILPRVQTGAEEARPRIKMGQKGPFLSSLDTHLPWSKEGVCPREVQEGPAEAGRAATGGSGSRAEGLLQLLGHLAGQLSPLQGAM